ncbi:hypothetical protein VOLCADRAFT_108283 [Volvox carteri f. nagariensis]|uniref:Uncharacterized protein n=1 Tax=Volvox carteri f. nagariensis TaxID=3068 RepID=D8UJ98_VOLCA|nr:uncharacterized protein VOLCADRAFT_108283 [Volvox carteri f. nagariensis]EFJ40201.1 hypothetical protein VOLCADRAFT_108283 [Volvox carteri f. nagariensis]|eukprot:XP_002958745.1 hypothetical protein VOLCADRAFT_108283 [Volvox carteri f. nagariensis]
MQITICAKVINFIDCLGKMVSKLAHPQVLYCCLTRRFPSLIQLWDCGCLMFRGRGELLMVVGLGVISGWYIFGLPLQEVLILEEANGFATRRYDNVWLEIRNMSVRAHGGVLGVNEPGYCDQ